MSRFFNKRLPFFGSSALSFGKVYFGQADTDPLNQDDNSKAPYVNVRTTIEGDAVQNLDVTGKAPNRLFIRGPYSIATVDADDDLVDFDNYHEHQNSDTVPNESSVTGTTLTDALNTLQAAVTSLANGAITLDELWPVGCLYLTTNDENPGSRLDHGYWELYSSGAVLCGYGAYTDSNGKAESIINAVEGTYQVPLTLSQMPEHRHMWVRNAIVSSGFAVKPTDVYPVAVEWDDSGNNDQYILKGDPATTPVVPDISPTSYTGESKGHDNVQPCIGVYIWRRVS